MSNTLETRTLVKFRIKIKNRKFSLTPREFQDLRTAVNSSFSLYYTYEGRGKAGDMLVEPVIKITEREI